MKSALLILTLLLLSLSAYPDVTRTNRGKLRAATSADTQPAIYDTITGHHLDSLSVAGYDKPLRSRYESLFVINHTDIAIRHIGLDITYYDSAGRMLHHVIRTLPANSLPGQTRLVKFDSWDPQLAFYYYRSPQPKRVDQATPYRVRIKIIFATSDKQ